MPALPSVSKVTQTSGSGPNTLSAYKRLRPLWTPRQLKTDVEAMHYHARLLGNFDPPCSFPLELRAMRSRNRYTRAPRITMSCLDSDGPLVDLLRSFACVGCLPYHSERRIKHYVRSRKLKSVHLFLRAVLVVSRSMENVAESIASIEGAPWQKTTGLRKKTSESLTVTQLIAGSK